MERAVSVAREEPTLFRVHLPVHIRADMVRRGVEESLPSETLPPETQTEPEDFPPLKEVIASIEEKYIRDLMRVVDGDVRRACSISRLSKTRLYARLNKYNIRVGK